MLPCEIDQNLLSTREFSHEIWIGPSTNWQYRTLKGLQKLYDLIVFLHACCRWCQESKTLPSKIDKNLQSTHVKYESDLLPSGYIWPAISWQLTHSAYSASYWLLSTHITLQDFPKFTDEALLETYWHLFDEADSRSERRTNPIVTKCDKRDKILYFLLRTGILHRERKMTIQLTLSKGRAAPLEGRAGGRPYARYLNEIWFKLKLLWWIIF